MNNFDTVMTETNKPNIYTTSELSDILKMSVEYICKELKEGRMQGYKKARRWYVFHSDLVAWLKASV